MLIQSISGSQAKKHILREEGKDTTWGVQTVAMTEVHRFKDSIFRHGGKRSHANSVGCTLRVGNQEM